MNAPTIHKIHAAKKRLEVATLNLQRAQAECDKHASINPLQVAFARGTAAGRMQTNPDLHWNQFVHHFGEVVGARDQFDAGLVSV